MPTYEYECQKCGREFEHSQKMSDDRLKKCTFDGCNGKVRRLVSAGSGVIFKGSGFYQTDYKNAGSKEESEPKPCPAAENKACPNSEKCPAAKAAKD